MIAVFWSHDGGVTLAHTGSPYKSKHLEIYFIYGIFSIFPEPLITRLTVAWG